MDADGDTGIDDLGPITCCPWCGTPLGSLWLNRYDDGSCWCEQCQVAFTVQVIEPPAD